METMTFEFIYMAGGADGLVVYENMHNMLEVGQPNYVNGPQLISLGTLTNLVHPSQTHVRP